MENEIPNSELLRLACQEAQTMYGELKKEHFFLSSDIREITRKVVETDDFEMFLCMGPLVKTILRKTRLVDAYDFTSALRASVRKLERDLGTDGWYAITNHDAMSQERIDGLGGGDYTVYDPDDNNLCNKKSGMFFLLLALSMSEQLSSSLLGILCTPTQFSMDCSGVGANVVMFDDMSYTGMQANLTLRRFRSATVYFVSPYIGTDALKLFEDSSIKILYEKEVRTLCQGLESYKGTLSSDECKYKLDAYPIIFYHKIADNISSFPEIYKYAIQGEIKPPYKNASRYPMYFRMLERLSQTFVFNCNGVH